ncbi:acyltransferase [Vibrio fluvialis]|nr:acyltransferase [Vibrio fluvialis]
MLIRYLDKIYENTNTFKNNTLVLRLILSFIVFYSHYFATYGIQEPKLIFGIHSLGWYAVNLFFLISGILISQSYRNRDFISYASSRALRVFPAYLAGIFISIFLPILFSNVTNSGLTLTIESANIFFSNLFPISMFEGSIKGAWGNTSMPGVLNTSLWTIPFEVLSYFFIVPIFYDNKIKIYSKIILMTVFLYFLTNLNIVIISELRYDLLRVFGYYIIGIGIFRLCVNKKINLPLIIGLSFIYYCEPILQEFLLNLFLITATVHVGFSVRQISSMSSDYSYAIYLFAWPVSQATTTLMNSNIYIEIAVASAALLLLSIASWKLIEKPCLKSKDSLSDFIRSHVSQDSRLFSDKAHMKTQSTTS